MAQSFSRRVDKRERSVATRYRFRFPTGPPHARENAVTTLKMSYRKVGENAARLHFRAFGWLIAL